MKTRLYAFIFILIFLLLSPFADQSAAAQAEINVVENDVGIYFPDGLAFHLAADSTARIQNVTLLYWSDGQTCQTAVARQTLDIEPATDVDLYWELSFARSGVLPPGSQVFWQWEIVNTAGITLLTEEHSRLINDQRHTWQSLNTDQIMLQWYEGNSVFGNTLLSIATQGVERLADQAGVHLERQIWITIYPTAEELQEAAVHASEWAGGVAFPDYGSILLAASPDDVDWIQVALPHEIAHLVTGALTFNCKGIVLPTWLDEGLAVYAEGDVPEEDVERIERALAQDTLPPLRTLAHGFSADPGAAYLSYIQSGMVVTYLLETYPPQLMAELLDALRSGQTIDPALLSVYGLDTNGIDAAWRASLGYALPTPGGTSHAVATRTLVPTIALWTSLVLPSATYTLPEPTSTSTPLPSATFTAQPSTLTPSSSPSPIPEISETPAAAPVRGISAFGLVLALFICLGVVVMSGAVALLFFVFRRRK